jgi:hypothetical protein
MGSVWTRRRKDVVLRSSSFRRFRPVILGLYFAALGTSCFPVRLSVSPPPPFIESMEGYVSFRFSSDGAVTKSRLSFLYTRQRLGRIEVLGAFNRTAALILIEDDRAACALPTEKVYWQGAWLTFSEKFLGLALSPPEVMALLSGQWSSTEGIFQSLIAAQGWTLHRDGGGRVSGGNKGEFGFKITEFFPGSPVPRSLEFVHPEGGGRLTTLGLGFNRPAGKDAFRAAFLEDGRYRPVTWEELESILKHEH